LSLRPSTIKREEENKRKQGVLAGCEKRREETKRRN